MCPGGTGDARSGLIVFKLSRMFNQDPAYPQTTLSPTRLSYNWFAPSDADVCCNLTVSGIAIWPYIRSAANYAHAASYANTN
jgi:hypothetical protein